MVERLTTIPKHQEVPDRLLPLLPARLGGSSTLHFVSILWICFTSVFLCFPLTQPVTGESINYAALVTAAIVLFFVSAYVFDRRKNYQPPHGLARQDQSVLEDAKMDLPHEDIYQVADLMSKYFYNHFVDQDVLAIPDLDLFLTPEHDGKEFLPVFTLQASLVSGGLILGLSVQGPVADERSIYFIWKAFSEATTLIREVADSQRSHTRHHEPRKIDKFAQELEFAIDGEKPKVPDCYREFSRGIRGHVILLPPRPIQRESNKRIIYEVQLHFGVKVVEEVQLPEDHSEQPHPSRFGRFSQVLGFPRERNKARAKEAKSVGPGSGAELDFFSDALQKAEKFLASS
ncbi:hypothetical protein B0T26DRAFT_677180 [Lasiosphaeria miniovina]|uniref:Uncharacterized protein n=1 Tax=Lasiosphaeria miniovina TaxID=1954250 RepID=A0AA40DQU8_9PEZI|nr:uncharacterized protein B0T26DRAFT_677180 [Lasiosphaeria miniovina]KAK0712759.1 hypothetical protein B0T26DRAFT_677180 [Lasiosphaeria miniovina]